MCSHATSAPSNTSEEVDRDEDGDGARKTIDRIYIKELVTCHNIWKDGRFWEQTLWHCVMEQVCEVCTLCFVFLSCFFYK